MMSRRWHDGGSLERRGVTRKGGENGGALGREPRRAGPRELTADNISDRAFVESFPGRRAAARGQATRAPVAMADLLRGAAPARPAFAAAPAGATLRARAQPARLARPRAPPPAAVPPPARRPARVVVCAGGGGGAGRGGDAAAGADAEAAGSGPGSGSERGSGSGSVADAGAEAAGAEAAGAAGADGGAGGAAHEVPRGEDGMPKFRFDPESGRDAFGRDPKKETDFWRGAVAEVIGSEAVQEAVRAHEAEGGDGYTDEQREYFAFLKSLDEGKADDEGVAE